VNVSVLPLLERLMSSVARQMAPASGVRTCRYQCGIRDSYVIGGEAVHFRLGQRTAAAATGGAGVLDAREEDPI
jgi:hypothetical protein